MIKIDRDGWNKIPHEHILNQSLLHDGSLGLGLGSLGLFDGLLGGSDWFGGDRLGLILDGNGLGSVLGVLGGLSLELDGFSLLLSPGIVDLLVLAGELDGSLPSSDLPGIRNSHPPR